MNLYCLSKTLKSFTYTNIVRNGGFASDLSLWTKRGNHSGSAVLNSQLNIIATGNGDTAGTGDIYQDVGITTIGDKFWFNCKFKNNGGDLCSFRVLAKNGGYFSRTITNNWQSFKQLITSNTTGQFLHLYASSVTTGANILVDDIHLINLTAIYGAGNEPSANDCDNIFKFVDGTLQPNFSKQLLT